MAQVPAQKEPGQDEDHAQPGKLPGQNQGEEAVPGVGHGGDGDAASVGGPVHGGQEEEPPPVNLLPVQENPALGQAEVLEDGEEGVEVAGHAPQEGGGGQSPLGHQGVKADAQRGPEGLPVHQAQVHGLLGGEEGVLQGLPPGKAPKPQHPGEVVAAPHGDHAQDLARPRQALQDLVHGAVAAHGHHPGPLGRLSGDLGGVARALGEEGPRPPLPGRLQDGPGKPPHPPPARRRVHDDPPLHPRILRAWAS